MNNVRLKRKILFIEDETIIQDLFGEVLLRSNPDWTIENATSLFMALQMLSQKKYDAVILDICLPDAVPEVVIGTVVKTSNKADIIVLSGQIFEDKDTYKQYGISSIISKTVAPKEACDKISKIVNTGTKQTVTDTLYRRTVQLTNTQKQVLHYLINQSDLSIPDIAKKMGRSAYTVMRHRQDIYRAHNVNSRRDLAAIFKN